MTGDMTGDMTGETGASAEEIERLVDLAARLLPGAAGMPPAADLADLAGWIGTALEARPDLLPSIRAVLAEPVAPAGDEALTTILAGAYLMHPAVREALGYPGQVARLARPDIDEYVEMLEAVVDRFEG